MSARPRYGVDGWPYLAGLSAAALALAPLGAVLLLRGSRLTGGLALATGLTAAVRRAGREDRLLPSFSPHRSYESRTWLHTAEAPAPWVPGPLTSCSGGRI